MEKLINALLAETVELKNKFIEKTVLFAKKEFLQAIEIKNRKPLDWCKVLNITPAVQNFIGSSRDNSLGFPPLFFNTEKGCMVYKAREKAYKIVDKGEERYLIDAENNAVAHYHKSINKLATRIAAKGLDLDSLSFSTCSDFDKGNIETVITDAKGKKVRAFTILAWGEINAPHYRYLVK